MCGLAATSLSALQMRLRWTALAIMLDADAPDAAMEMYDTLHNVKNRCIVELEAGTDPGNYRVGELRPYVISEIYRQFGVDVSDPPVAEPAPPS
jgi:hypothetical protein